MNNVCEKLRWLKIILNQWESKRKKGLVDGLVSMNERLEFLADPSRVNIFSWEVLLEAINLEHRKRCILRL